jgi:hypothetical protein
MLPVRDTKKTTKIMLLQDNETLFISGIKQMQSKKQNGSCDVCF